MTTPWDGHMINFNFSISNPWYCPFGTIKFWTGKTPFANKFWEFELYRNSSLLNVAFGFTVRQSHAGLNVELGLLGFNANFTLCDNRHWDYENNCYEIYDKKGMY